MPTVNSLTTSTSLQSVKGIGPARAEALSAIGINTVSDLLHYYPRKHLDRTTVTPISKLKRDMEATIIGKVEAADLRRGKRQDHVKGFLSALTGAQSAMAVNNNAAGQLMLN
ncbi:MAG: hypothetical protein H8E56_03515 [Candidatus Marinimicrobia bacterium]|nr:hypothetical protein [Candidatus Neomarinimicrobiota bacterium]